ncbi:MAG: tetratricopeptide repeat protein [Candidatus Bipolaricaulaceae bacterium]
MAKGKRKGRRTGRGERLSRLRAYGVTLLLLSMPIFFLPGNTEYGYTKSVYTLVFVSGLLLLWVAEGLRRQRIQVEVTRLWPLLPALIAASLLSLAGGPPLCLVLQSTALLLYFGLAYLLVVNSSEEDRHLVLHLAALLAAAVVVGIYGLLQYLGTLPGGPGRGLAAVISTMGNREYLAAFLGYLLFPTAILVWRLRRPWTWVPALVGWGTVLALVVFLRQIGVQVGLVVAACGLGLALGLWPARGGGRLRWGAVAATTAAALGMAAGWTGLLVGLLVAGLAGALWGVGRLLRRVPWTWIPVGAAVVAAILLLIPPTTPLPAVERAWERNSGRIRAWDWWVGYHMWSDNPVFGVGLGAYKVNFVPYKAVFLATPRGADYDFPIARAAQAHNEYVQVAAELGTIGLLALAAGLAMVAYFGLRRIAGQTDPARRLELLLLGAGVIVCLVHAVVSFPWHLPAPALAFVVCLGLAFSPRYGPVGGRSVTLKRRWLAGAVVGSAALGATVSVVGVRDLVADRLLQAGQHALYLGNVPRARTHLERAVALDFCPRISLYWLGMAQLQAGDPAAAQSTLRACLPRYRTESLYINLASVDVQLGDYAEARRLLSELLATRPSRDTELGARYLLAVVDLGQGDTDAAQQRLRDLLQVEPRFERALILLGDLAKRAYRYSEAKDYYQRALEVMDQKIAQLEARLRRPLTAEEFGETRSELERLRRQREAVAQTLAQLP